jgi:7-keto-8-aminopelargonate synthetase-like enzyme/predicted N-acyltransferase
MQKKVFSPNLTDTAIEIFAMTSSKKVTHLFTSDEKLNGREIHINGHERSFINFGSCSYLGLEMDQRLKDAACKAAQDYGSQFSCSRAYLSYTLYEELEDLLRKMFNAQIILNVNSGSAHQSVIPAIIREGDAVVFDQQAHITMQELKYKLIFNGITVDFVRHSRLDELQKKIDTLSATHNKIWYFLDGVYSMYGDFAPIQELKEMLEKNEKLFLYVDDAHSMSLFGKNGTGYVLSHGEQHPRMIITVSLAKGFGSSGGITLFADDEMYFRAKNYGICWTHSGPQQPAVVGASIASAKIHLSPEIYTMQKELQEKISYCNEVIQSHKLPSISCSNSAIFYIGLGTTRLGCNMIHRLLGDGFYVNLGMFPGVNERCAGIRFTITRHHTKEDIDKLMERIAYHLPQALIDEGMSLMDIYKAFRSIKQNPYISLKENKNPVRSIRNFSPFKIQKTESIKSIPQKLWDDHFADEGNFDWQALSILEEAFSNNPKEEDNWKFYYYIITDDHNKPIIMTFLTSMVVKDDMFADGAISKEVETRRAKNGYYLTSKSIMIGSLITEGDQLYIDRTNSKWREAMRIFIKILWEQQEELNADSLVLRDFKAEDTEIKDFLMDEGFVKIDMPSSNVVEINWNTRDEYISNLSGKNRKHLRQQVLPYEKSFGIKIIENANQEQIDRWYKLYDNVRRKNFQINSFPLPIKLFQLMSQSPLWDCIEFSILEESKNICIPIGIIFAYKNKNYSNAIIGLDYDYIDQYKTYRQGLFQTVMRGIDIKANKIFFGLTADFEKRKIGAITIPKVAYVQHKDSYNNDLLCLISKTTNTKKSA